MMVQVNDKELRVVGCEAERLASTCPSGSEHGAWGSSLSGQVCDGGVEALSLAWERAHGL